MGFDALEIFLLKATQEAPASALVIKIESVVGLISLRINLDQLQPKLVHLVSPHLCHLCHLCHLTCVTSTCSLIVRRENLPTDIGLPWMHLKDFDFPQPQAFCQNYKSTKYSLYRPATTAMTATKTPARIQAKTAPAHPGWPETSKSDASTCKWVGGR